MRGGIKFSLAKKPPGLFDIPASQICPGPGAYNQSTKALGLAEFRSKFPRVGGVGVGPRYDPGTIMPEARLRSGRCGLPVERSESHLPPLCPGCNKMGLLTTLAAPASSGKKSASPLVNKSTGAVSLATTPRKAFGPTGRESAERSKFPTSASRRAAAQKGAPSPSLLHPRSRQSSGCADQSSSFDYSSVAGSGSLSDISHASSAFARGEGAVRSSFGSESQLPHLGPEDFKIDPRQVMGVHRGAAAPRQRRGY